MIYTINVKTKETTFDRNHPDHVPMARNQFGDATPGYLRAWIEPNYPMPAIVKCYCGCSIEAHRDRTPCDYLGFFNFG